MIEITYKNHQKKLALNPPAIQRATKKALKHLGIQKAVLSIVFVSRQRIVALNKKFLSRDHGTDVLAFDTSDRPVKKRRTKIRSITGDIVISTDAARKNARNFGSTMARELMLYVIHGILHLSGYDDHSAADTRKMRKKEQDILEHLGSSVKSCLR